MAENQTPLEGPSKEEEEETLEQSKVVEEGEVIVENLSLDFSTVFNDQNPLVEETLVKSSLILSNDDDDQEDSEIPSFSQLLNSVVISSSLDSMEILSVGGKLTVPPTITVPDSLDKETWKTNFHEKSQNMELGSIPETLIGHRLPCVGNTKTQYSMSHQGVVEAVTAHNHNQTHDECPISSVDLIPDSVSQSILSVPSPVPAQQSLGDCLKSSVYLIPTSVRKAMSSISPQKSPQLVPEVNSLGEPEIDEQKTLDPEVKATQVVVKAPTPDGYNWRKYGQKQVKSSESNRSYYRCTYVNCYAKKKVESCDHSSRLVEIIYKGQHNHDPPRKVRSFKGRKLISSAGSGGDRSVQKHATPDSSKLRKETRNVFPKQQLHNLNENVKLKGEEERLCHEPIKNQRKRQRNVAFSIPPIKTVKERKVVVQAAGDVGISSDGYRWRKYGQKMVKGSSNPRSYYKCTSAGCPVRKHVERATEDTSAIIITYEGKHDHDMPALKKRYSWPSSGLVVAAAAAAAANNSTNTEFSKVNGTANQKTWSVDMVEGGKGILTCTSEIGGEKFLESARTLLSIGIELKPC